MRLPALKQKEPENLDLGPSPYLYSRLGERRMDAARAVGYSADNVKKAYMRYQENERDMEIERGRLEFLENKKIRAEELDTTKMYPLKQVKDFLTPEDYQDYQDRGITELRWWQFWPEKERLSAEADADLIARRLKPFGKAEEVFRNALQQQIEKQYGTDTMVVAERQEQEFIDEGVKTAYQQMNDGHLVAAEDTIGKLPLTQVKKDLIIQDLRLKNEQFIYRDIMTMPTMNEDGSIDKDAWDEKMTAIIESLIYLKDKDAYEYDRDMGYVSFMNPQERQAVVNMLEREMSNMVAQESAENKVHMRMLNYLGTQMANGLHSGNAYTPVAVQNMLAALNEYPDQFNVLIKRIEDGFQINATQHRYRLSDMEALGYDLAQREARGAGSVEEQQLIGQLRQAHSDTLVRSKKDPYTYLQELTGEPREMVAPGDYDALWRRLVMWEKVKDMWNLDNVPLLEEDEVALWVRSIDEQGSIADRAAMFGMISQTMGWGAEDQFYEHFMDTPHKEWAVAGQHYAEAPQVSEGIIKGMQLMADHDKIWGEKRTEADIQSYINEAISQKFKIYIPPLAYAPLRDSIVALQASKQDPSNPAKFDKKDVRETVKEFFGSIVDLNGKGVIPPSRAWDQAKFEEEFRNLDISKEIEGQAPDGFSNRSYTPKVIEDRLKGKGPKLYLLTKAPGTYYIQNEDGNVLNKADGTPFEFVWHGDMLQTDEALIAKHNKAMAEAGKQKLKDLEEITRKRDRKTKFKDPVEIKKWLYDHTLGKPTKKRIPFPENMPTLNTSAEKWIEDNILNPTPPNRVPFPESAPTPNKWIEKKVKALPGQIGDIHREVRRRQSKQRPSELYVDEKGRVRGRYKGEF